MLMNTNASLYYFEQVDKAGRTPGLQGNTTAGYHLTHLIQPSADYEAFMKLIWCIKKKEKEKHNSVDGCGPPSPRL